MRKYRRHEKQRTYVELRVAGRLPLLLEKRVAGRIISGLRWSCENRGLRIFEYSVMPDRLAMIADVAWGSLTDVIHSFRTFSSKAVVLMLREGRPGPELAWKMTVLAEHGPKGYPEGVHIWDERPVMDSLIRPEQIDESALAIRSMAVRAGFVNRPEHYLNCSAHPDHPLDGWIVEAVDSWS